MSDHSTYDALRHIADSWGLVVLTIVFLVLAAWPFRPGARSRNEAASTMIFREDEQELLKPSDDPTKGGQTHGQ